MAEGDNEDARGYGHVDDWDSHFAESIRDWLIANGVNWDRVCAWPEIEVAEDGESFTVEMFYRNASDKLELMRGLGGSVLTTMRRHRHTVKIDPDLLAAYQFSHRKTHDSSAVAREAAERFLLHHPPAIRVHEGSRLVWVVQNQLEGDELAALLRQLEAILPGVRVSLVSGVHAVFAGPGPWER
jgi:hypothetical protein